MGWVCLSVKASEVCGSLSRDYDEGCAAASLDRFHLVTITMLSLSSVRCAF
jgi:hypothetical protein